MGLQEQLHFQSCGSPACPPVVFLHGFMGSARDWDSVIEKVSAACYCVAIDLPGHGKSVGLVDSHAYTMTGAALNVVKAMEASGAVPATVVGYSMGGRLALYLATHHGFVCSRLVVESATAGILAPEARKQRKFIDEARAKELEEGEFEDFLRTWYCQDVFKTVAESRENFERMVRRRLVNNPEELARSMRAMSVAAQPALWDQLSKLTAPVLLLAGEKDAKYVSLAKAMQAWIPKARFQLVPGAGHNAHLEQSGLVAGYIKDFVLKE